MAHPKNAMLWSNQVMFKIIFKYYLIWQVNIYAIKSEERYICTHPHLLYIIYNYI